MRWFSIGLGTSPIWLGVALVCVLAVCAVADDQQKTVSVRVTFAEDVSPGWTRTVRAEVETGILDDILDYFKKNGSYRYWSVQKFQIDDKHPRIEFSVTRSGDRCSIGCAWIVEGQQEPKATKTPVVWITESDLNLQGWPTPGQARDGLKTKIQKEFLEGQDPVSKWLMKYVPIAVGGAWIDAGDKRRLIVLPLRYEEYKDLSRSYFWVVCSLAAGNDDEPSITAQRASRAEYPATPPENRYSALAITPVKKQEPGGEFKPIEGEWDTVTRWKPKETRLVRYVDPEDPEELEIFDN